MKIYHLLLFAVLIIAACNEEEKKPLQTGYTEQYRQQIHFSPKEKWMNDPNGMLFVNGTYHLFFQYYPDSTVWGPMHWGHATSKDLVHWQQQPIALYPDSLGYIFSGSAVADTKNTSGFGKDGKTPLVAIFTHHDPKGESAGQDKYQNQSLAYSLDDGQTWVKYTGNPVLKNPGIKDFRDPKVSWYEAGNKWLMTLATKDRISFYSSANLKDWTKESEFGEKLGAHGGVWECPDLFPIDYAGEKVWVLLVSINPGGPNGGSATQYFTGKFDGKTFVPNDTLTRWIDYGPDDYAGVTWSNTGDRRIFLGWMGNWDYAGSVPTEKWRSAMTVPRELGLIKQGNAFVLTSTPVKELDELEETKISFDDLDAKDLLLTEKSVKIQGPVKLSVSGDKLTNFTCTLSNAKGEKCIIGYDKGSNTYYIDRKASGKIDFEKRFAGRHTAPRLDSAENFDFTLFIDNASVELFADKGKTSMTSIFFPTEQYSEIRIQSADQLKLKSVKMATLKSIWATENAK